MKFYDFSSYRNSCMKDKILLTVRLTIILMLGVFLQVSAGGFAQITLIEKNAPLEKVLKLIGQQSGYDIFFNSKLVKKAKPVTITVKQGTLQEALNQCFSEQLLGYTIESNTIVVFEKKELPTGAAFLLKQLTDIIGKVLDETGQGLSGATVKVKGAAQSVMTDENGNFRLNNVDDNAILVISYLGYNTQEIKVTPNLTIKMVPHDANLNEIVVVGYGTQKKSDITGSVASVPKERLSQLPVTNALQAVQGAVSGVNITQSSSVPGSGVSAVVRGVNSISASTGPFLVVDGIPFSTTGGSINDINPADIASIEILKDASAVAIYGTRGANGVILVTTKRGKTGKAAITYNVYGGMENFSHKVQPMGPEQYVQKYADWKAQAGSTDPSVLPNAFEQANHLAGTTTNWLDEVERQGYIQNHTLSISGGSEDVKYYISGDYLDQKGVIEGYQYKRGSVRSNLDATLTSYLTVGLNLFLTSNNSDGGRASLTAATQVSPYGTFANPNGTYAIYPMFGELLYINPMLGLVADREERSRNINSSAYAELKPGFLKGLKFRINAAYNDVPANFASYLGRAANNLNGTATVSHAETKNWLIENILTYDKNFKKNHLDITALYSAQQTDFNSSGLTASGFINDELSFANLASAATTSGRSFTYKTNLASQMLRLNYSFDSKYLFTATARRDGYSAFGSGTNKYGVFPSFALGWNISNEDFMKDSKFINTLKLRGSYGLSGNQAIDPNATTTTASTARLPFNGLSTIGVVANVLGNKNLNWESTYGANIGIDFALMNNRLSGSLEAYSTHTKDLLLYRSLPTITGYTRVLDNLGKVANKGFEVSLKSQNLTEGSFKWETIGNFSTNKNKIVDLYGDKKDDIGNKWFIGQPVNVVYDYVMQGVWQTGESPASQDPIAKPGDLKFADVNGSNTITADDRAILGQTTPKWIGGLTNTFHYRNLHLNIFIQTAQGMLKNNTLLDFRDQGGRQNVAAEIGYWTTANQSNSRPSIAYNNSRTYGYPAKANYTRIKDVSFSFTAPKKLLESTKLAGLTLYASGRNLATFTNWVGWDPEADYDRATGGVPNSINSYPLVRSVVFGANISLR